MKIVDLQGSNFFSSLTERQTWIEYFHTQSKSVLIKWFLVKGANLKNKKNQSQFFLGRPEEKGSQFW